MTGQDPASGTLTVRRKGLILPGGASQRHALHLCSVFLLIHLHSGDQNPSS